MWPWEHAILGYLLYSTFVHTRYREPPDDPGTIVVVIAAVLPDLIDKPLAWQFGVFESGYAIAHSVLFAVPLSIGVGLLARSRGRSKLGAAFAVGYLSHLFGDVIPGVVRTGELYVGHLLWPIVVDTGSRHTSFSDGVWHYFVPYVSQLLSVTMTPYLAVSALVAGATFVLWIYDGTPGPGIVDERSADY